jgi:hypothetical protein
MTRSSVPAGNHLVTSLAGTRARTISGSDAVIDIGMSASAAKLAVRKAPRQSSRPQRARIILKIIKTECSIDRDL